MKNVWHSSYNETGINCHKSQLYQITVKLFVTVRYLYSAGKRDLGIANNKDMYLMSVLRGQGGWLIEGKWTGLR